MPHKLNFTFVTITLCTRIILCPQLEAGTIYVTPDGTGDGSTWGMSKGSITAALISSVSGDQIWVASGTYMEAITMKTGVSLYGGFFGNETTLEQRNWTANEAIIDANGKITHVVIGADEALLDGFTITGGNASSGGGVYCYYSSPRLYNCVISDNTANDGGGVYCYASSPTLCNCVIKNNTALFGGALYSSGYQWRQILKLSLPSLTNCTISGNYSNNQDAVFCYDFTAITITNCIIWNYGGEIFGGLWYCKVIVKNSCIRGGYNSGEGNISVPPLFVDPENGNYQLCDGSPCINRGTTVGAPITDILGNPRPQGVGVDIGAYETPSNYTQGSLSPSTKRIYVRSDVSVSGNGTSWAAAIKSISWALFSTNPSDEIWVKAGTYYESVNMDVPVSLYGGFEGTETSIDQRNWLINETIIDATGRSSRPTFKCRNINNATLDGFTITGGMAGGVSCIGSSLTINNCSINGNLCDSGGAVNFSFDHSSTPLLTNCLVTGNSGSGVFCYGSSPTLINCTISGNSCDSRGALNLESASPTLINCILWNIGTEIKMGSTSIPKLSYCCVEDGYPGTGNIITDPLLVAPTNGDYHLQTASPCIDKGIGPALNQNIPISDIDGDRRSGNTCDIGADEYSLWPTETPTLNPINTPTATLPLTVTQSPTKTVAFTITTTFPSIPTITRTTTPTLTLTDFPFNPFDTNNDGQVDARDLIDVLQKYFRGTKNVMEFSLYWKMNLFNQTPTPTPILLYPSHLQTSGIGMIISE